MIAEQAQAAAGRLAPAAGVMLQAVWFDAGREDAGRLLLVIHHLAVDGVSWRILLPDLKTAWESIAQGRTPALPAAGSSFRRWAHELAANAQDPVRIAELPLWTGMWDGPVLSLFDGALDRTRDRTGTARELTLTLPATVTGALLTRVAAAFHAGINDVLLTGLALAVTDWCRRHGRSGGRHAVLVDVEGHGREEFGREEFGREEIAADLDLSRTVGWFTSLYPVRLDPSALDPSALSPSAPNPSALDLDDALAGGPALGGALKAIKEQLRALPDNGLGYGLLRYLNPQTAAQLAQLPTPQIGFNYLGRFPGHFPGRFGSAAPDGTADWAAAPEAVPLGGGDPALALAHAIEINALTLDGPDGPGLSATWTWAPALIDEAMVRDLAQGWFRALAALARHATVPGAGGRTPSDLPLVQADPERDRCSWSANTRGSTTSCRWRRCRRACCSMRCTMRRRPTSIRSSWFSTSRARSTPTPWRRRRGGSSSVMPTCARASGIPASTGPCRSSCRTSSRTGATSICHCWTRPRVRNVSPISSRRIAPGASIWPRRRCCALR